MSRKLASLEKILKIEPIKGADQIELVTVLGWHCIVRKEENYKVGDLVVYFEYDTVLPEKPEFEFLRSCCYSKRYNGFRIRNRKLRGVFSEGIVFKISTIKALNRLPVEKIKEGLNVSEIIGVRKYDPDEFRSVDKKVKNPVAKYFMRYKWFRKIIIKKRPVYSYPEGMGKANENNIQVVFNKLKDLNKVYYKSEKIEGCLHYENTLWTSEGIKTIKEICDNRLCLNVLSYNELENFIEEKPITNWFIHENDRRDWYEVELEDGTKLKMTNNHRVFLPELNCWRRVDQLNRNDFLLKR